MGFKCSAEDIRALEAASSNFSRNNLTWDSRDPTASNRTNVEYDESVTLIKTIAFYVVPVELVVGLICQLLNLLILHGQRIRSLTYTIYLKALSISYLLGIFFLLPNILISIDVFPRTWILVVYKAHLDNFLINFCIFSGNLIVVALAAEPLRALLWPFHCLSLTSTRAYAILSSIYSVTIVFLVPVTLKQTVRELPSGEFCHSPVHREWLTVLRFFTAALFEVSLLLGVGVIYICLLLRYQGIVVAHKKSVNEMTATPARLLSSNRKATAICLGSVTAYLLTNVVSAVKEMLRLADHFASGGGGGGFERQPWFPILINLGNILLLFNYTLTFLLQYAVSTQYRQQLHKILCRGKLAPLLSTSWNPSSRLPTPLLLRRLRTKQSTTNLHALPSSRSDIRENEDSLQP